ncbi:N-acetylglucosamine kinase [Chitinophaga polysaccharea]|uniref:BadF/BadG/BcrA/BcrD ATPase family protein n=1 Tax=Chitinophaga TaxID=79328 RepID=UPI001455AA81|nr:MULTISPECIES: BadF/BadG/BcrA/BcrD ATPase family protein [Chitinophaga]NLR61262.1 N-acetylglucosamine kinase [Chitinophaga polysaccharea]NLU95098.1 N-acetylglucosamine kinase [Chitinophaga sp. Ak27]
MGTGIKLIADSGSTKTEWGVLGAGEPIILKTQGVSPYFQSAEQIRAILVTELLPQLPANSQVTAIYFYGTGLSQPKNLQLVTDAIKAIWPQAEAEVQHDLMGAARSLCGREEGVVSILGTGSNSCYYDGKEIVKNNPGLGYILGDEGSGAYLGKKVLQYYLYNSFDEDLHARFEYKYKTNKDEILENVYRKPLANRYLAGFTTFLSENRQHFMIENILEDGLNDFFFNHIYKYRESWTTSLHFTGGVAWTFRDILTELCELYELPMGKVLRTPMDGLLVYHR